MERPPFAEFNIPLEVEASMSERWGGELDLEKVKAIGKPKGREKTEDAGTEMRCEHK